jgi:hypothetical protein
MQWGPWQRALTLRWSATSGKVPRIPLTRRCKTQQAGQQGKSRVCLMKTYNFMAAGWIAACCHRQPTSPLQPAGNRGTSLFTSSRTLRVAARAYSSPEKKASNHWRRKEEPDNFCVSSGSTILYVYHPSKLIGA